MPPTNSLRLTSTLPLERESRALVWFGNYILDSLRSQICVSGWTLTVAGHVIHPAGIPARNMLSEAFQSRSMTKPQDGQECVLTASNFGTNSAQPEHRSLVFLGSMRI